MSEGQNKAVWGMWLWKEEKIAHCTSTGRECSVEWSQESRVLSIGWSKETVNCNFSLTYMKNKKNGKTQSFLEVVDREVLIFWCLERVRWKKSCLSRFCQNGRLAPVWLGHASLRSVWELSWSVWRHLAVSVGVCLCLFCFWVSGGVF